LGHPVLINCGNWRDLWFGLQKLPENNAKTSLVNEDHMARDSTGKPRLAVGAPVRLSREGLFGLRHGEGLSENRSKGFL
jgi:hypothetical protein